MMLQQANKYLITDWNLYKSTRVEGKETKVKSEVIACYLLTWALLHVVQATRRRGLVIVLDRLKLALTAYTNAACK